MNTLTVDITMTDESLRTPLIDACTDEERRKIVYVMTACRTTLFADGTISTMNAISRTPGAISLLCLLHDYCHLHESEISYEMHRDVRTLTYQLRFIARRREGIRSARATPPAVPVTAPVAADVAPAYPPKRRFHIRR